MFYNVKTKRVEDFTDQAISDIEQSILDTPIDPLLTFLKDPLRLLRVVRFAQKFDFKVSKAIIDASSNPKVQE